jgi:hypothetical protein
VLAEAKLSAQQRPKASSAGKRAEAHAGGQGKRAWVWTLTCQLWADVHPGVVLCPVVGPPQVAAGSEAVTASSEGKHVLQRSTQHVVKARLTGAWYETV